MDEVKYQELKDATEHAIHNGGRVSVAHDVMFELLAGWKANQAAILAAEAELKDPEPFFPTASNEVSAADLDAVAEEEKAKEDTSKPLEPTVQ